MLNASVRSPRNLKEGNGQAVSRMPELSGRRMAPLALAVGMAFAHSGWALPTGEQVISGTVSVSRPSATSVVVNQGSSQAIVNWNSFGIAQNETARFVQPSSNAVILNNILGGEASKIFGRLQANGQVFLVNPSGVLFAPGAQVDVTGLVASSLGIGNRDFLARNYSFSAGSGTPGAVVNQGVINAAPQGYVALIGPRVSNSGTINTPAGSAGLAAGNAVVLDFDQDGLMSFKVDPGAAAAQITNAGAINADGGRVVMNAQAKDALLATVLSTSGIVRARGISTRNGEIFLDGGGSGVVSVSGQLDASGRDAGQKGGTVKVLGDKVGVMAGAVIDVSGDAGGGTVLVGGDFQGKNASVQNASSTFVAAGGRINADALTSGNGGKVIVWSNDATRAYGTASARGGSSSGNGGLVEISGKKYLDFRGSVDTSAPRGVAGQLLLDPDTLIVQAATPDLNGDATTGDDLAAASFATTGQDSIITAGAVNTQLNTASVSLTATNGITVNSAIAGAGAGNGLALNATAGTVTLNAGVTLNSGAFSVNSAAYSQTASTVNAGGGLTTITVSGASSQAAGAAIAGTGGLTKAGAGTLALAGTNTYTGVTTVSAGTLSVSNAAGLAAGSSLAVNGGTLNINGVTLNTLSSVSVQGAGTSTAGAITGTGTSAYAGPITLASAATLGGTGTLTLSGVISGAGNALTKTGAGTVTLSGAGANTYNGLTTVSAGTLNLNKTAGIDAIAGNLTTSGGTVVLQAANQIKNTANVVVSGGTLAMGANSDTVNGVQMSSGSITGSGGTLTSTTAFDMQGGTVSAILGGTAGLNATTGTTTLSAANTYTGTTTVGSGTLNVSGSLAAAGSLVVSGGTFDVQTNNQTLAGVQLTGGAIQNGTLTLNSGNYDLQTGTVSAALAGTAGANKTGAGTVTLSGTGANTYSGLTTVSAGTLNLGKTAGIDAIAGNLTTSGGTVVLQAANQMKDTASVVVSGGTLAMGANSDSVNGVKMTSGSITGSGGTLTSTTAFDMQGGTASAILGGTAGLNATTGTTTLSAANTYTGTTAVGSGTLNVSGSLAAAGSLVVSGGTFDVQTNNQTLAGVQLTGGTIQNGTLTLNTGNYDLQTGTVSAALAGTAGANKTGAGTVTLSGAGANTYSGLTTVSAGTLNLNKTAGIDAIAGNLTTSGGTVVLQAANQIKNTANVVVSGGTLAMGANSDTVNGVQMTSGSITGSGGTLTSTTAFDMQGGTASAILGGTAGLNATTGTTTLSAANTYTGTTTVSSGTLNVSGSLAAAGSLVVSGGTFDVQTNNQTLAGVQLTSGTIQNGTLTLNSGNYDLQTGTVSAALAGTAGANKTGAGAVSLSGTGANSYSGLTTVSAGTLNLGKTAGIDAIAGNLTASGGTVVLQAANQIKNTANVVVSGGTLAIGANSDTVNGVQMTSGSITGSGGTLTSTTAFDMQQGDVSAALAGTAGANKTGAGTVTLSGAGANTYSGLTTVSAGTLNLGKTAGIDAIAGNLTTSGGTVVLQAANQIKNAANVMVSGGTLAMGANSDTVNGVQMTSGSITGSGGTLTSTTAFDMQQGNVSASLGGTAGANKTTAGTVLYSSANSYTGTTTVTGGTLSLTNPGALNTGSSLVVNGGTLEMNAVSLNTLASASVQGSGAGAAGAIVGTGSSAYAGPITLAGNTTVSGTGTLALSGVISGAGSALSKDGAGTLILSNANTYGSTTLNTGTLRALNNAAALGAGTVTLAGGTLQLASDSATAFNNSVVLTGSSSIETERVTAGAGVTHTLGTLSMGAQTLSVNTDATLTSGTAGLTVGNTTLTGAATLAPSTGVLVTTGSVAGAGQNLVVNGAGSIEFAGAVGSSGAGRLGAVTITTAKDVTESGGVTATSLTQTDGTGNTLLTGAIDTSAPGGVSIRTSGAITANGAITTSGGTVVLTADNMALGASINSAAGLVMLQPKSAATQILIGGTAADAAGKLGLSNAEIGRIASTGGAVIGTSTNTGGIDVVGAVTTDGVTAGTVTLTTGAAIGNSGSGTITSKALALNAATGITATTNVQNLSAHTGNGGINLNNTGSGVTLGSVLCDAKCSGEVIIASAGAITLGGDVSNPVGAVRISAETGISETGAAKISADVLQLGVSGAGDIAAGNANLVNTLGARTANGNIRFSNAQALSLSNLGGTLTNALESATAGKTIDVQTTAGALTLSNDVTTGATGNVYLSAAGAISEAATAKITTSTLGINATAAGDIKANNSNKVDVLGAKAVGGSIQFSNTQALSVAAVPASGGFAGIANGLDTSATTGKTIDVRTTAGTLTLNSDVTTNTTGNVYLTSATGIKEAGTGLATPIVTTGILGMNVTGAGDIDASNLNRVGALGAKTANGTIGFVNANASGLDINSVADNIAAGGNFAGTDKGLDTSATGGKAINLTSTAGSLRINSGVTTGSIADGGGAIYMTSSGVGGAIIESGVGLVSTAGDALFVTKDASPAAGALGAGDVTLAGKSNSFGTVTVSAVKSLGLSKAGSVVEIRAPKIKLGKDGIIAARVILDALGTNIAADSTKTTGPLIIADAPIDTKLPALTINGAGTVGQDALIGLRVLVGGAVAVDPGDATSGVVYLVGDNKVKPKYEFSGDPLYRAVLYNGVGAQSTYALGALDAAYLEIRNQAREVRESGFAKENAAKILRQGVVTEAGPGQPAIDDNRGMAGPKSCDGQLNGDTLSCGGG